ncbi:MAG: polyprenyl synthetase family protein [Schwartzia sp. (in: firmicutes)]
MLQEEWQKKREQIEAALVEELHAADILDKTLAASMEYSLMAGGKRLRPVLLMAAAEAVGGRGEDYLTAACAIEMIHTYSLIHDDLPAMDDDDYRRGKPTNHKVYGAGMATLAGDALLTMAFEVLLRQSGVSDTVKLSVLREVSEAAGAKGMVGGQAMDLGAAGQRVNIITLRRMHMGKTGALFRAAVRVGTILAGGNAAELVSLTRYAESFGLAFQITDDILDVVGETEDIGKPAGSDERNQKATYVTLATLSGAEKMARDAVDTAVEAVAPFGNRADFLREMAKFLLSRKQ